MAHPRPHLHHLPLLLLLVFPIPHPSLSEEEPISVDAPVVAVETGYSVEIACTTSETQAPRWYVRDNATSKTPIPENSTLRIYSDVITGTLTVKEAVLNDSRTYLCQTFSGNHSAMVDLHVYDMPSDLTQGLIILAISIVLTLVFVGGVLYEHMKQRKRRHHKSQAKHQEQITTSLRL